MNHSARLTILFAFVAATAAAQTPPDHRGVHQMESEAHANDPVQLRKSGTPTIPLPATRQSSALSKKVLGWYPYWVNQDAYLYFDYAALTHIAYFSYEVDTATGSYLSIHDWTNDLVIETAHGQGLKVLLTVTNFGTAANAAFLSDTNKQKTLITTLINLLKSRPGDGVNFDFESVPFSQRNTLVAFIQRVRNAFNAQLPSAEISMATPAVDWSGSWDLAQLSSLCNYLVVMGYDYYWSGSTTAGPVAPMASESYNVMRSLHTYLNASVPAQKLWLGVPWYGYDFYCNDSSRKSARFKTYSAKSRTLDVAESMVKPYGKLFDTATEVPWFYYGPDSCYHHVWYDDSLSLSVKYDSVKSLGLGGIGIWALTYNGSRTSIYNGIKKAFQATGVPPGGLDVPAEFSLAQNYPNPFNPSTTIVYRLAGSEEVTLRVFDMLGREVAVVDAGARLAGEHTVRWNAGTAASGVYFYQLRAGSSVATHAMLLLR